MSRQKTLFPRVPLRKIKELVETQREWAYRQETSRRWACQTKNVKGRSVAWRLESAQEGEPHVEQSG